MSYGEDILTLDRLEKVRLVALILAFVLRTVEALTDAHWLTWPRVLCWVIATVAAVFTARTLKRLGRDNDFAWLYAVLCGAMTLSNVVDLVRG